MKAKRKMVRDNVLGINYSKSNYQYFQICKTRDQCNSAYILRSKSFAVKQRQELCVSFTFKHERTCL